MAMREELRVKGQGNIQTQMQALALTFKQYSQQNKRLTDLYQLAKMKGADLHRIASRALADIAFLRGYCADLESELLALGYFKHHQREMLSRKETADSIFLTYDESLPALDSPREDQDPLLPLRQRIATLEAENRLLKQQLQTQPETQQWKQAAHAAQQRVTILQRELRLAKGASGAGNCVEEEQQRRGIASFIMKDRSQLFSNIHMLIGQYKKKIDALAHEKKEVERRYKQLKERVSRPDENSDRKLVELYAEKIEVLQRLTEKQQMEIENTIELYQVELAKIEERRREEIDAFETQRIDLETQNLRLCIDLQRSLNRKDQAALQLMQQRNKNQILLQEIKQLRSAIESYKHFGIIRSNLAPQRRTVDLCIQPDLARSAVSSNLFRSTELSMPDHAQYQYSEVSERRGLIERIEEAGLHRQGSAGKKPLRDRITITYGQPSLQRVHICPPATKPIPPPSITTTKPIPPANLNKSYDSVMRYKRRFIERKPQGSQRQ